MGTSFVLVSAVVVALAAGVLVAYTICVAIFAVFNSQTRQIASRSVAQLAVTNPIAE